MSLFRTGKKPNHQSVMRVWIAFAIAVTAFICLSRTVSAETREPDNLEADGPAVAITGDRDLYFTAAGQKAETIPLPARSAAQRSHSAF